MGPVGVLEIYRLLDKSNCRRCELPTCLAFAAAVIRGEKGLGSCPHVDSNAVEQVEGKMGNRLTAADGREEALDRLRSQVRPLVSAESAVRVGASHDDNMLTVRCLSKDFHIESTGTVRSDCHTTHWLVNPLLNYIIHCAGKPVSGKWVPFKDLEGGNDWSRLFEQRCEKPLKRVVDMHTDLFEIMIDIFDGKLIDEGAECDISVAIRPLPRVPVLIRYWKKEGDFDSALTLLFDATAADNLGVESLYMICVGMVSMFEKIAITHGHTQ